MEDIINGPLPQLFALMMVPIVAALLIVGFLVFSATRRRKKSKMKHGLHSSKSEIKEIANSDETPSQELDANTNVVSEVITQPDTASAKVLSNDIPAAPPPSRNQIATSLEDKLNLGLLGKSIEPEVTMENTPKPTDQKPVDLAARLGSSSGDLTPPSQVAEPVELLRLLRDPQSGQLIVEVAGQRYTKLASITDKKVGQYILKLTAHLLAFTNGVIITDAGMKSVYHPKGLKEVPMPIGPSPTSARQPAAPPPQKTTPMPTEPSPPPKPLPEVTPPPLGSLQPPPSPPQPGGLFQPAPPPPSMLDLNLAEEINDIVQTRLQNSPLAGNNRIEITSDHHGGIRIQVNNQFYSSPDDVPDPDVKELIKASIKEWERN